MLALAALASWWLSSICAVDALRSRHQHASTARAFRAISIPAHFVEAPREDVSALPAELSLGSLTAYEPSSPANGDLLLFLAGSGRPCDFYREFLELVGRSMSTLCVPYDNRQPVAKKCLFDKECYSRLRREALDGDYNAVPHNNIEDRVVSALRYLSRTDGPVWGRYLDAASGLPLWRSFRVAGHSQGAGNAAWIGYHREVARVVQFSGVCDLSDWPRRAAPAATPGGRFFGMGHALDSLCSTTRRQEPSWRAEGAFGAAQASLQLQEGESTSSISLGGAQTIVSHILPPSCRRWRLSDACHADAHESTVGSVWDEEPSPYAAGVWQALVGI